MSSVVLCHWKCYVFFKPVRYFSCQTTVSPRTPLAKKSKFSIEYSIGCLLIVFYKIFANSFL